MFTFVCARVHKETIAPVNTLYRLEKIDIILSVTLWQTKLFNLEEKNPDKIVLCRAYVKGDVAWHDYDLVFITIHIFTFAT